MAVLGFDYIFFFLIFNEMINIQKAVKRKANFEESKKMRERLQAIRKVDAASNSQ